MIYAILAYHDENIVNAWTEEEDAALMTDLLSLHRKLVDDGKIGPAARLAFTNEAVTIRTHGKPLVIDGPFAETKEQLLGIYLAECADMDEAVATATKLAEVNTTCVYEVRPVRLLLNGAKLTAEEPPPAT